MHNPNVAYMGNKLGNIYVIEQVTVTTVGKIRDRYLDALKTNQNYESGCIFLNTNSTKML